MKFNELFQKVGHGGFRKHAQAIAAPLLFDPVRFPYGPFQFKTRLPKGTEFAVEACTDLKSWTPVSKGKASAEVVEYLDSEAFKHTYRFYRLNVAGVLSSNALGYAAVTLPPGFSMIANPFESGRAAVEDFFKGWPDGTSLNRFDTLLFKLAENVLKGGKWSNPGERLRPGEGAIFFNPTSDYKSVSFSGEVLEGNISIPIPSGFSMRSSMVPQPGSLVEDLAFPIAEGDVIHLFDRDRQQYVLYPFQGGKWSSGVPVLSVGEAFWVAKTEPGNWTKSVHLH